MTGDSFETTPTDGQGTAVFVGSNVRVSSLPNENRGKPIEEVRQSSIGRICRIAEPYEGTSTNGIQISTGEFRVHYTALSPDGIQGISFYVAPGILRSLQLQRKCCSSIARTSGNLSGHSAKGRIRQLSNGSWQRSGFPIWGIPETQASAKN